MSINLEWMETGDMHLTNKLRGMKEEMRTTWLILLKPWQFFNYFKKSSNKLSKSQTFHSNSNQTNSSNSSFCFSNSNSSWYLFLSLRPNKWSLQIICLSNRICYSKLSKPWTCFNSNKISRPWILPNSSSSCSFNSTKLSRHSNFNKIMSKCRSSKH